MGGSANGSHEPERSASDIRVPVFTCIVQAAEYAAWG